MRRWLAGAALLVATSACGAATVQPPTGPGLATALPRLAAMPHPATSGPSGLLEAAALIREAPVVPGSVRRSAAPDQRVSTPSSTPAIGHLATRRRWWTSTSSVAEVLQYLRSHVPAGLSDDGDAHSSGPSPSDTYDEIDFAPRHPAPNLAYDELDVGVVQTTSGVTAIGAFGVAATYPPRPANELASRSDEEVNLTQRPQDSSHVVRARSVSGSPAQQVVTAFDTMDVYPGSGPISCPLDSPDRLVTHVTIRSQGHVWRTTDGFCGMVDVTRDGHHQPTLQDAPGWGNALQHALTH